MPEVRFTKQDLQERTPLSPGWRVVICKSIDEGPGKNDPTSTVYPCVFEIAGDGPESGIPIRHWFSEKTPGRIADYIRCFLDENEKLEPGVGYKLEKTINKKVEAFCRFDPKQGYNGIEDFRNCHCNE
jgi:hypothetical protein